MTWNYSQQSQVILLALFQKFAPKTHMHFFPFSTSSSSSFLKLRRNLGQLCQVMEFIQEIQAFWATYMKVPGVAGQMGHQGPLLTVAAFTLNPTPFGYVYKQYPLNPYSL